MTRVYLVRHGQHELVDKALAGRMPGVHLAPEGREQAQRVAAFFVERGVTAILSSPIERCRETAAPIAERLALGIDIDPDLIEVDCGDWTGKSFDEIRRDPRWNAWNGERARAAIPGGDTMGAVRDRVMRVVDRLADQDREPVILVSHADVIKTALLTLLGSPLERHDRIVIDPASITTVDLWPGGGKIVRMNEVAP